MLTKLSETEYKKVTPQPDKEEVGTLATLDTELKNAELGLKNNQDGVIYHTQLVQDIQDKIAEVKALGVKEKTEVLSELPVEPVVE